jgi:glucans biosynthesis protein C
MSASPNAALAAALPTPQSGRTPRASHNVALGYLRTFAVILVLAHHSALAYMPGLPLTMSSLAARPRWWTAFPILDSQRWIGFRIFAGFNDAFLHVAVVFSFGLVRMEQP